MKRRECVPECSVQCAVRAGASAGQYRVVFLVLQEVGRRRDAPLCSVPMEISGGTWDGEVDVNYG